MKSWKLNFSSATIYNSLLTFIIVLLAIAHQPALAVGVLLADEAWRWWRHDERSLEFIQADSWLWLSGIASIIIISLSPNFAMQLILSILFSTWRWWLLARFEVSENPPMIVAAITQSLVLWAVFLATAVWHWPTILVLVIIWGCSWTIAWQVFASVKDRAAGALALTWALIVAESSWVFSLWLVNYVVFNGLLIIPQPALVISALGYCLAGIYTSHRRSQLTRKRLVEYLTIGLVILVIVIAGTKWNGVI